MPFFVIFLYEKTVKFFSFILYVWHLFDICLILFCAFLNRFPPRSIIQSNFFGTSERLGGWKGFHILSNWDYHFFTATTLINMDKLFIVRTSLCFNQVKYISSNFLMPLDDFHIEVSVALYV